MEPVRSSHSVLEALDRVSGARYRIDPTDFPDDVLRVLQSSGWYVLRPIERESVVSRPAFESTQRSRLDDRRVARHAPRGSRTRDDVA